MSTQTPTTKMPSVWQKIEVLQTADLPNFPSLGKKMESPLKEQPAGLKRQTKVKGVTFIVAPSRIVELKKARLNQAFPEITGDPTRFNHTKPCKNIAKADGSDEYGVCTRDVCTYAHSLQEYKVPRCVFGDKCYRRDQTGDRSCTYLHPKENLEMYCDRTGKSKPDLPETSDSSRRPEPKKIVPVVPAPVVIKTTTTPKPTVETTPVPVSAPKIPALVRTTPLVLTKNQSYTTVIRVPKEMFEQAMELAIKQKLQDFKIVIE